jgi:hypothetical protein
MFFIHGASPLMERMNIHGRDFDLISTVAARWLASGRIYP